MLGCKDCRGRESQERAGRDEVWPPQIPAQRQWWSTVGPYFLWGWGEIVRVLQFPCVYMGSVQRHAQKKYWITITAYKISLSIFMHWTGFLHVHWMQVLHNWSSILYFLLFVHLHHVKHTSIFDTVTMWHSQAPHRWETPCCCISNNQSASG